eukprot:1763152-Lingulodinium_polyedra.AAC.1
MPLEAGWSYGVGVTLAWLAGGLAWLLCLCARRGALVRALGLSLFVRQQSLNVLVDRPCHPCCIEPCPARFVTVHAWATSPFASLGAANTRQTCSLTCVSCRHTAMQH